MENLDPRLFWVFTLVRSLCETHPDPQRLRQAFERVAEEHVANFLHSTVSEAKLQSLLAFRDGYEAWIPKP
jgi:hypothetical protein